MRRLYVRIRTFVVASGLILLAGCSVTGRNQLESSLRQHEARMRNLEEQLAAAKNQLRDQEDELLVLRQPAATSVFQTTSSSRMPETAVAWGSVRKLRIHSLASGILRSVDNKIAVNIIIQPLDHDGEVVKVAGELSVRVQLPGETSLLTEVTVSSLESRSAWSNGFVARGFLVQIPLKSKTAADLNPDSEILVTASLDLGGDRRFKATRLLFVPK